MLKALKHKYCLSLVTFHNIVQFLQFIGMPKELNES